MMEIQSNLQLDQYIATRIQPRNALEEQVVTDDLWRKGALWGKPRKGHPEGRVVFHIAEVLDNVDLLADDLPQTMVDQLRLITLFHDTYKFLVDTKLPKRGANHHARIASRCASSFNPGPSVLKVVEVHDDAYHIWLAIQQGMRAYKLQGKVDLLMNLLADDLYLFYSFYWCDNRTGNKDQRPLEWFTGLLPDNIPRLLETA